MYQVYWKSKRKQGIFQVPTPKNGWVKTKKDARDFFYRWKKYQQAVPRTARIVKIIKK